MKKYAVAYMNFFDNDLKIVIIEDDDPIKALIRGARQLVDNSDWLDESVARNSLEVIKAMFFDADQLIEVKEIK